MATDELRSPQRPRRVIRAAAAWAAALSVAATLAFLLVAGRGPLPSACCGTSRSRHRPSSSPPDPVELTIVAAAHHKGAGTPPCHTSSFFRPLLRAKTRRRSVPGREPAGVPPADGLRRRVAQLAHPSRGRRLVRHRTQLLRPQDDLPRLIQVHAETHQLHGHS
ncbi:hypothetical protein PVAP13_5KG127687 [Panicum virgatum]|uniref:Uncharacterized protein n=1 Tax=Panicum virgatum TaxID=38727 RepID=A0A8T0SA41_PANVG|nr:hypothetical protein PVAP13_5KG127687 [Panicum virgatum]